MSERGELFSNVLARRLSRREVVVGAGSLGLVGLTGCAAHHATHRAGEALKFEEIPHRLDGTHHVPPGYRAEVLIAWGDPILSGAPPFAPLAQNGADQAGQFGNNNDFIGYLPLTVDGSSPSAHFVSRNSEHGLLCVNNEHSSLAMAFPPPAGAGLRGAKRREVEADKAALGHSIVEIRRAEGRWQVVVGGPFNRRLTADSPMLMTGPAAGSARLRTSADPSGRHVLGTFANCAGGITPWATVLTAEENFRDYFAGDPASLESRTPMESRNHRTFDIGPSLVHLWHLYDKRFDIEAEPNEPNRFGWIVEIDPYDPGSTPRKRTALGRCQHEAATVAARHGHPVAVYSGDDKVHECIYKFVSGAAFDGERLERNRDILDEGTLYVARFDADGSGEWIPLVHGSGPLVPDNGFSSQADVLIDLRRAAACVGATRMDRPEDIETNPVTGRVYVALTKNKERGEEDAANSRAPNPYGHILELLPPGEDGARDHTATTFTWETFALAGDPDKSRELRGAYHPETGSSGWFCNPDNFAFDSEGRLWVATDGFVDFGVHDGIWATETVGSDRARFRHFFGCPAGAEACGPEFTPDGRTFFVAVQHPGRMDGATFENPATRWPDFDDGIPPRSAVVAITRVDGGRIGS